MKITVQEIVTTTRGVDVPVLCTMQTQGDVAVRPVRTGRAGVAVTSRGVVVVQDGAGGAAHVLLPGMGAADGSVRFERRGSELVVGVLVVDKGATALLAHERHGFNAIGPGIYEVRRQREAAAQRDWVASAHRLIVD